MVPSDNCLAPFITMMSWITRHTKIAVNIEIKMPSDNVTANPLIGPVPNWNSTSAVISVVRFESKMVPNALS